jgi:hypothetical protein
MAGLRISSKLGLNGRGFYLCQAYTQSGRHCLKEALWTRLVHGEPTYLCEQHNQALDKASVRDSLSATLQVTESAV